MAEGFCDIKIYNNASMDGGKKVEPYFPYEKCDPIKEETKCNNQTDGLCIWREHHSDGVCKPGADDAQKERAISD